MSLLKNVALLALATALACSRPPSGGDGDHLAPAERLPRCQTSDNAIDRAACPRFLANQCASAPLADTSELCRRMHLDLVGVLPTPAEIARRCEGKTPREIAERLLEEPAYVRHQKELWAERLSYDPAHVDGTWLVDADKLVEQMVTGKIGYDTFARRIIAHPVIAIGARQPRSDINFDEPRFYPQVARKILELFLGRAPIAGEDEELGKLFRPWKKNIVILNVDYGRAEPYLDPTQCPCTAHALGRTTTLTFPGASSAPYAYLSDSFKAELDKPGALLVAQETFLPQLADLALTMFLGWWKESTDLTKSFLPEVQKALADDLHLTPSFRDLVLTIVTSELYTRSNRVPDDTRDDLPAFCTGPLRLLRPEAYVASLGRLLGVEVGRCDHRTSEERGHYDNENGTDRAFFPYSMREDRDSDETKLGTKDFHQRASRSMGGCSGGIARSESPALPFVFGGAAVAGDVCRAASSTRGASELVRLLLSREPTAAELAAFERDASSSSVAADACAAIARSVDFVTY